MDPFLAFELLWFLLLGACTYHAHRKGLHRIVELYLTIPYGIFLEILTIYIFQGYVYGRFLLMVGEAPLCIGVGWAVIIYTFMELADTLPLNEWLKPLTTALFAVALDLWLDPISVKLGFWTFIYANIPFSYVQWYGSPWLNFVGWFLVATIYPSMLGVMRAEKKKLNDDGIYNGFGGPYLGPTVAMVISSVMLPIALMAVVWTVQTMF